MSNAYNFLFEIGVEELPPKNLSNLEAALITNVAKELKNAALSFENIESFATPRRLAIAVKNLIDKQDDRIIEQRGPALKAAFDKDGAPTAACIGFANACGTAVENLEKITTEKGAWVFCKVNKIGETAEKLLPQIISQSLKNLPIGKYMRWGVGNFSFARPVHWILMLYNNKIINCELFGVAANNKTYGHRFHFPQAITVSNTDQYEEILHKHRVIAAFDKRKEQIRQQILSAEADYGQPIIDEDLLDEVAGLVEWPQIIVGKFDARFLNLPPELLILVMQKQQRYFPLIDSESKKLAPYFITISNIESKNPAHVIKGNENVIHARLADAEFFYNNDARYTLDSYSDHLKEAVFLANLGSLYDKSLRMLDIAFNLAQKINANSYEAKRAAELSKADLMTTMVGEFPELQGVIGYYYALRQNEPEGIAAAIKEQYLPRFARDILPQTDVGRVLALADKLDTLIGAFCLNKIPTGEKDPLGLRRAALGILRIILESKLDLDLKACLHLALKNYRDQIENFDDNVIAKNYMIPSEEAETRIPTLLQEIVTNTFNFILERMRVLCVETEGIQTNIFTAAINAEDKDRNKPTRPLDIIKRIQALKYFIALPEAEALSIAHKRVNNILANTTFDHNRTFDELLSDSIEEKELFQQLNQASIQIYRLGETSLYQDALSELTKLKPYIDHFFDKVMVMVDDAKIRNNRLVLLNKLRQLFAYVADIAALQL